MDSTELDFNNSLLSSTSPITSSNSDDYDKDLRLAAELGRYLLERNHELENYINVLQKELDDKQCDMKLLHAKFLSTREQLEARCKQTEILDAANFDLEQELALQRRENEKHRQRIKELSDLCNKTRKQYQDIHEEYSQYRAKQYSSHVIAKQMKCLCQSPKRQRSNSMSYSSHVQSSTSTSSNLFESSSASLFKSHLVELKHHIKSLSNDCTQLNDQLRKSEQDKRYLIDRINQLERQRWDDNDSVQNELNQYRKLLAKYSNENRTPVLSTMYSPPEYDLSLYDEVLLEENQTKPLYEPTNYKDLFARVYEKLKFNISRNQ